MKRTRKQAVKDLLMLALAAPLLGLLRLALPIIASCIYVKRRFFKPLPRPRQSKHHS